MAKAKYIRERISELQASWELLTKRIGGLRKDLALNADGDNRVVLEIRLRDLEQERDRIESELNQLEQELSDLQAEELAPDAATLSENDETRVDVDLEVPTGAVPLGSPFYIEREADTQLKDYLGKVPSITTIRGTRQMGKTSLLVRGVDYAKQQNKAVCFIDCQGTFDFSQLTSLELLLKHLAYAIADQTQIDFHNVDAVWQSPLSHKLKIMHFLQDMILKDTPTCFVLVLDEADIVLRTSFYSEFFGLLRAWYNRRTINELWKKLQMVVSISTDPSLLIDDLNQSPFNVGVIISLQHFSLCQIQKLNIKHGILLQTDEIMDMIELLGGHPYLVRRAFYTLKKQSMSWPELCKIAADLDGPFGGYLRYYLGLVMSDPDLEQAMRQIVFRGDPPPQREKMRLLSAGLIYEQDNKCICRCGIYELFFRRALR